MAAVAAQMWEKSEIDIESEHTQCSLNTWNQMDDTDFSLIQILPGFTAETPSQFTFDFQAVITVKMEGLQMKAWEAMNGPRLSFPMVECKFSPYRLLPQPTDLYEMTLLGIGHYVVCQDGCGLQQEGGTRGNCQFSLDLTQMI